MRETWELSKKKVIQFDISEEVYDSDCHVFIGKAEIALDIMNEHLKENYPKEETFSQSDLENCYGTAINFNNKRVSYLWLPGVPKSAGEHGTLAHEICHIVLHYFNQMGFPIDHIHDEPVCYFMKFMVKTFWVKVRNYKFQQR